MKVLDHEPQWWFLLEDEVVLYVDANCNHSVRLLAELTHSN